MHPIPPVADQTKEASYSIPPVPDLTREALEFAQNLADKEIKSIDRLHKRSIAYIKDVLLILGTGLGVIGSLFAFFGYLNLRNMAVAVAEREVRHEVEIQVQQKLNKEEIKAIVDQQIKDFAAGEMRSYLKTQVETGPLHQEILQAAARQTQQLITNTIGQRRLTSENATKLVNAIDREALLKGYWITLSSTDIETYRYYSEITKAIRASSAKVIDHTVGQPLNDFGEEGTIIYYERGKDPLPANALLRCFLAAGISAKVESAQFFHPPEMPENRQPSIHVYIGPRPLPEVK